MIDEALGVELSVKVVVEPKQAVSTVKSATGDCSMETVWVALSVHPVLLATTRVTT